jgi:predicted RecB family nuclease
MYLDYVNNSEGSEIKFQKIIDYNEDDCIATRVIKDWLVSIQEP